MTLSKCEKFSAKIPSLTILYIILLVLYKMFTGLHHLLLVTFNFSFIYSVYCTAYCINLSWSSLICMFFFSRCFILKSDFFLPCTHYPYPPIPFLSFLFFLNFWTLFYSLCILYFIESKRSCIEGYTFYITNITNILQCHHKFRDNKPFQSLNILISNSNV